MIAYTCDCTTGHLVLQHQSPKKKLTKLFTPLFVRRLSNRYPIGKGISNGITGQETEIPPPLDFFGWRRAWYPN